MKTRKYILILLSALIFSLGMIATDLMAKKKDKDDDDDKDKGGGGQSGMVIFDMTASPGDNAISTNLSFVGGGSKSDTAIDDGIGFNTINIQDFHVLTRDRTNAVNELKLSIGENTNIVQENLLGAEGQLKFFAAGGGHLFDLNRLREAADWMAAAGNLSVDSGVSPGTYGTLSFLQFLNNVDLARTMYGFVRVRVPLELGTCTKAGNCDRNSLGALVDKSTLYGLCASSNGLCSCAPVNGYKIQEGKKKCDDDASNFSNAAQIRVKGSLLWDFVASEDNAAAGLLAGDPVPFELLPWAPRELYFKVEVPIMVNWEYDLDGDGAMDNMFNIAAVSQGWSAGILTSPAITWAMVAPTNKVEYEYYTGNPLTEVLFAGLDNATKYHLMIPNGYPSGWAEAFDKLNITGAKWAMLASTPFGLPSGYDNTILTADVVRDENFEDIPAYLYSGGLIDMHDHVNISGLVYVPQGMELEAKDSNLPTRQFFNGAVVVRDTFFIEAKSNTVTVISAEPSTYSNAIINLPVGGGGDVAPPFVAASPPGGPTGGDGGSGSGGPVTGGGPGGCGLGLGCTGGGTGGAGSGAKASIWIEVRPQVPPAGG